MAIPGDGRFERGQRRMPGAQIGNGGRVKVRSLGQFGGQTDPDEQPADAVGRRGYLEREDIVEPAEHAEFGQRFIIQGAEAEWTTPLRR